MLDGSDVSREVHACVLREARGEIPLAYSPVIAPPSINPSNHNFYNFISGDLSEISKLPCIRLSDTSPSSKVEYNKVAIGGRNRAIFSHLIQQAGSCDTLNVYLKLHCSITKKTAFHLWRKRKSRRLSKVPGPIKKKGNYFSKGSKASCCPFISCIQLCLIIPEHSPCMQI